MKLENAWPGVFIFYLKSLWAATLHCMALASTEPDNEVIVLSARGAWRPPPSLPIRPTPAPAQGARRPVWGNAVHTMLELARAPLAPPPPDLI